MTVQEMAIRSEVRQMLNEAGLNRETLKDMVKDCIYDVVKNQVNQVLMEKRDKDLSNTVSKYLDSNMRNIIRNSAESVIREKMRSMNFSVNVITEDNSRDSVKKGITLTEANQVIDRHNSEG